MTDARTAGTPSTQLLAAQLARHGPDGVVRRCWLQLLKDAEPGGVWLLPMRRHHDAQRMLHLLVGAAQRPTSTASCTYRARACYAAGLSE